MTGSVLDGEDVVQEALFQAYRMLDRFDDSRLLARSGRNRRRPPYRPGDAGRSSGSALGRVVEHLVLTLPPKERACALLKDVFDCSLEEIVELVGSTVGGVKAALKRGRSKLPAVPEREAPRRAKDADEARLLHLYVERFNRRDWDGLRELIAADACLRVADRFIGSVADSPYFGNYGRWPMPWRLAVGEVDGEPVVIILYQEPDGWNPKAAVRLEVTDQLVTRIADYLHCHWIHSAATSVVVGETFPN